MLFTVEFAFADRDNRTAAKLTDLDFFTIVDVLRVFLTIKFLLFDRDDFVAR